MVDEAEIRRRSEAGELAAAATLALERYGPEVLGFLESQLGDAADADDVFAQTCEDLWSGLSRFEWRSSLRTWFYVLARHAAVRWSRSPHRRAERRLPLSQISDVAEQVRSRTAAHLRTAVKDELSRIRDSLSADDRALLVLRIDREMDWNDIALVIAPDEAGTSSKDLARVSARLRKRFQLVKDEVREQARAAGLLRSD